MAENIADMEINPRVNIIFIIKFFNDFLSMTNSTMLQNY